MEWKKNKKLVKQGFFDLAYMPPGKTGWNQTLASLAFGVRSNIEHRQADLCSWAARHCLPASERFRKLGSDALVLWHGTSSKRADKIKEYGLFSKGGLWTTTNPRISHGFCRWRSKEFDTEGAVLCIVLNKSELKEGKDFDFEGKGDVLRFHYRLPPDVVEYILTGEHITFTGKCRAREPQPWAQARFKIRDGKYVPVQHVPVTYYGDISYASFNEFCAACFKRYLNEIGSATALEIFSTLYSAIKPMEALTHENVFGLIEKYCLAKYCRGWQVYSLTENEPG